jgi:hypothetical protein
MNKYLDSILCDKYPDFYRYRDIDVDKSMMYEGFCCEDGWFTLIHVMSELIVKHDHNNYAIQIKKSPCGLRFVCSNQDEYLWGVQIAGETLSNYICDTCGSLVPIDTNFDNNTERCIDHINVNHNDDNKDSPDIDYLKFGSAWTQMIAIFKKLLEWNYENKSDGGRTFFINVNQEHQLYFQTTSNDEVVRGIADVIACYCNCIDERSGKVIHKTFNFSVCDNLTQTLKNQK